jgi:cell division ATPase FtsA
MENYIKNIIEAGIKNGLTLEQLAANPSAAAEAYLDMQLKGIEQAGEKVFEQMQKEFPAK